MDVIRKYKENDSLKKCCGCQKLLLINSENFHRDRSKGDNFRCQCKICELIKKKKAYKKNRLKKILYQREYGKKNKEQRSRYNKEWREKNKGAFLQTRRRYENNRYKTDVKFALSRNFARKIRDSLRGNKKGRHWEDIVGYTIEQFKRHLKKTMPDGYVWKDYFSGKLHIDHIIPIAAYDYKDFTDENFKRCWSLSNLRLLPAKENHAKNAKIIKPFQPALPLTLERAA